MKRWRITAVLLFCCFLCTVQVFAANPELSIDENSLSRQRLYNGAYTDLFHADILTEKSAALWEQIRLFQEEQRRIDMEQLQLDYTKTSGDQIEQVYNMVSTLPIFAQAREYHLTGGTQQQSSLTAIGTVFLVVVLGFMGFFSAKALRTYQRRKR